MPGEDRGRRPRTRGAAAGQPLPGACRRPRGSGRPLTARPAAVAPRLEARPLDLEHALFGKPRKADARTRTGAPSLRVWCKDAPHAAIPRNLEAAVSSSGAYLGAHCRQTSPPAGSRPPAACPEVAGHPRGVEGVAGRFQGPGSAKSLPPAGVPWAGFRALRHTAASRWLLSGIGIAQVSRLLGHAEPSFEGVHPAAPGGAGAAARGAGDDEAWGAIAGDGRSRQWSARRPPASLQRR